MRVFYVDRQRLIIASDTKSAVVSDLDTDSPSDCIDDYGAFRRGNTHFW
jgi:hypothetical protein